MRPGLVSGLLVLLAAGLLGSRIYAREQAKLVNIHQQFSEEQQRQALREDLASRLRQLDQIRSHLAPEVETEWLFEQVHTLAQNVGINVTSLTPLPPKPLEEFTQVGVNVQFESSYHQLGTFLSQLENAPAFLQVDDLEVGTGPQTGVLSVRITISSFSVPLPTVAQKSG